jgi:hypothetical protein
MDRKSISELYNGYLDKFILNIDGVPIYSKDDINVIQNAVDKIFSDINKNQSLEIGDNRFLAKNLKAYDDFTEDGAQVLTSNLLFPITQDKKIIDLESLFDLNSSFDGSIESIYKRYDDVLRNNFNEAFIGNPLTKEDKDQVLENRKILTQMAQEYEDFDPFESDKDVRDFFRTQQGTTQLTGPQRGDQYYDPKRKRQYVYEGPDETFEGMHSFISDQGRTFVGNLDDLEKFTDESKFLNIDDLSEYRSAIDDLDTFLGDIRHGSKSMEDGFWDRAQKAVKRVNKAEGKVKKKIKHHRMENDSYKKKKVLQGYINDWKQKHTQQNTSQPETTQRRRRRGNVEHRQHTVPNRTVPQPDPDLEDMDGGPDWDGGANDFDQGAYYEEEWFSGYNGADDAPFGAEDFDDEFLANLTDEQIFEQARNNEELERYIKMRDDARARLGLNSQTFNMETENRTINNNFNGVNQEHQQQQRSTQGNQEHKIDTDKPWTWTDDDIRIMADGDPDAAIDLINQREQARQQQQAQNQQRETQEQTKNTAEETTSDTSGSSNQEPPETNTSTDNSRPVNGPETRSRKQRIEDAGKRLGNNKGPNGSRKRFTGQRVANNSKRSIKKMINKRQLKSKKFRVKGDNLKEVVANTVVSKMVGEATETVQRLNPNFLNGLDDFADLTDDDIAYFADQISDRKQRKASIEKWKRNRERAKKERKNKQIVDDFENGKFDYDPEKPHVNRIRHDLNEKLAEEVLGSNKVDDVFGWMKKHKIGVLDVGFNLFSSIGDYKDSRRKGHGVISSAARAAGSFAVGEMLGFWGGMGVTAFKLAGTGIVKGTELLYKENRRMNSAANNSVFGAAEFQDTQQLATMRQSGMEMAKMAQYNLQQTLMGNEATYLHR